MLTIMMIIVGVALAVLSVGLIDHWNKKNRRRYPDAPRVWFQMNRANKKRG